jgi:hypothetical protein
VLADISFYSVVLFVHIAAVVLAFGVTFTYALVFSVTRKGYERHLPYLHHIQAVVGERIIAPLGGVILAAGGAYFGPREKRLSELAARDIEASPDGSVAFSAEYEQQFRQLRTVVLVANALVLLAIFLMVTKP